MKNGDLLRKATDKELAEIIASLRAEYLQKYLEDTVPMEYIRLDAIAIFNWLNEEGVSGDYIN